MTNEVLKNKFGLRFSQPTATLQQGVLIYTVLDTYVSQTISIEIDSASADPEIVIQNVLSERIINYRDKKLDYILHATKTKENRTSKDQYF